MLKNHIAHLILVLIIGLGTTNVVFSQDKPTEEKKGVNFIITQSPKIIVNVDGIDHNRCFGEEKGAINISAEGGYPPYSYFWTHGDTTQDVTGLKAGKYMVAVSDNFSCSDTVEIVINEPLELKAKINDIKNVLCYGYYQGEIDIDVEGGVAPYTYSWSDGSTSQDLKDVISGRYSVLITDANSCQEIITADIKETPLIVRTIDDVVNIKCFGDVTGKIDISTSGGVEPYTYYWSNGDTTQDISNLKAGTYEVTVQDAAGCTEVSTAKVIQPDSLTVDLDKVQNIRCFGDNGGAINIAVNGGTTPYSYNWSNEEKTQDIAGVFAGEYSVEVTDINNCINKISTTITQPPNLEVTLVSSKDVTSHSGSDGIIDIDAQGGVAPYKYNWNNGATTQDISKLIIGNYSVKVTDAQGCSKVINSTINQPAPLVVKIDKVENINCNGDENGEIAITVNGGVKPYSYSWSNGSIEEDISGLKAGNYSVSIIDANGFKITADTLLTQPPLFAAKVKEIKNINCFGVSEGAVDIDVTGGVPPYKYHWSNGMITQNIIDVPAGDFTVKIIDANRCEQQLEATIMQPEEMLTSITSVTNVACQGNRTGAIDVTVTGGVEPYKYFWSNGSTTQDLSSIVADDYRVTITDAKGCEQTLEASVTEPVKLLVQEEKAIDIDCYGNETGEISLIVSGGVTPYTYLWNNGSTTKNINGLKAGNYSINITDANGCSVTYAKVLTQPTRLNGNLIGIVDNSCFGDNKGEIDINVTGGVTPYSYRWSTGASSQDVNNLRKGDYKVEIRDANRCLDSLTATIKENPLLEAELEVENINCNGENSGSINLTVTGGVGPYTYDWSNGAKTQDISGLKTGQYSVTITDAKACIRQVDAHIIEPSRFVAILESETMVKCYGESTGSIKIRTTGGNPPYVYNWSNGATSKDLQNIPAGNYTLSVADASGCSETISTTITQPTKVNYAIKSVTNLTCNRDNTGAIDISITGGLGPYTYEWSNGATTQDIVGVAAGQYSVTISEANGCSKTLEATITEPPVLSLKLDEVNHILCNGNNTGTISATTTGGVPPYVYSWSNGSTREDISGLVAGKYVVTVTDAKGCSETVSTIVKEPAPFVASLLSVRDIKCNNEKDGEVKINVKGGVRPYKFVWSTGDTTQNLTNIGAGNYSVRITDKNGCAQLVTATVNQPEKLVATLVSSSNVSCNGGADAAINITVVGGQTPYKYSWSNGAATQDLNNIPVGRYSVGITDANGCTDSTIVVVITEPEELIAKKESITEITTYGLSTGAVDISVEGGSPPYGYSWSNGAITQDISGVPSGNYSLRVVDTEGCESLLEAYVKQPPALEVRIASVTNISCNGDDAGAITVNVSGGVKPYTFVWSNGDSTQNISNVVSGDYSITVLDANGHRKVATAKIAEPTTVNVNVDNIKNILCYGDETGSVIVSATGGVSPYRYRWSNGATTKDLTDVKAGSYTLKVIDKNGCQDSLQVDVKEPLELLAKIVNVGNISCNGDSKGEVFIDVSGGIIPYSYSWSNGARTQDISDVIAGEYSVKITDANGCYRELRTVISEPPKLVATIVTAKDNQCFGEKDGEIRLQVSGGVGNYSYIWSHGDNQQNATQLVAGDYSVIVRDSVGCEQRLSATINEPTKLVASVSNIVDVNCNGENNGAIDVDISGGSAPYTYSWSNGTTTKNLSNIVAGDYVLDIKDAKGCNITVEAQVKEPTFLTLKLDTIHHNACAFDNKGLVDITVSGGVPPYSYSWNNGSNSEDLVNVISDSYSVQVKDANGCVNTLTAVVTEPDLLTVAIESVSTLQCNGDENGEISLKVLGGVKPYTYLWSNGATTASLQSIIAGEYEVQVTDNNGCQSSITTIVNEPPTLVKTIDAITDIRCFGDSTGAIHTTALEGTPPYQFEWSNGETTASISNLKAGTYTLKITEANGCVSTLEATVEQPTLFAAELKEVKDVNCFGDITGEIDVDVVGGVEPYAFSWSNGATTEDIKDIGADDYSVMITDANGCLNTINTPVVQPEELTMRIDSLRNVKCCGDNSGAIFISVEGGEEPYQYQWSNGATTQDIENLILGQYTVNITDARGCTINSLDEDDLNLYDQVVTSGKFVTRDINFDVAKATIKPESFRTINKISTLMKEHPDLTFRIDGHSDSDGPAAFNQTLSEDRAESIRRALIKFGIHKNRLYSRGWGESKPIATNLTAEGKAKNRRVEFVSLTGTLTGDMIENSINENLEQEE